MSDLIDRQAAIADAQSWIAVNGFERNLQKKVVEWLKEFPPAELGTNLAEVGTDCISRQAALDIFDDYNVAVENGQIEAYSRDRKRLCGLPHAQPQRTGKWIKITKGAMREKYMCSACGRTIEEDGIERLVPIKYPFCHCGAKMEGAADNG